MIRFPRKKNFNFVKSFIYRLDKIIPAKNFFKIKIYTYLEWIFARLAMEHYGRFRETNNLPNIITELSLPFVKNFLSPGMKVIDLGCGRGETSILLADYVAKVVGVDYNASAIKIANSQKKIKKLDNVEFFNMDIVEYFKNNEALKYDVLVCDHIIEHLEAPFELLDEIIDRFRYIYIQVPESESSFSDKIRADLNLDLRYTDDDHIFEYNRRSIQEQLANHGINIVEGLSMYGMLQLWCENQNINR